MSAESTMAPRAFDSMGRPVSGSGIQGQDPNALWSAWYASRSTSITEAAIATGGTGAAPNIFKNNISVPTLAALARARKHLDARGAADVTLVLTGGLRTESDFVKALAMGADAVAVSNSALQAIGCLGMRACHTNNCPVGIATQKQSLRSRLLVEKSAQQLTNWFEATVELMKILARACGHDRLSAFSADDLTTWKRDMAHLTGIRYGGVSLG